MERADAAPRYEPLGADVGVADGEYVLAWLRQSDAPENIIGLQERMIRILIATETLRVLARQSLAEIERVLGIGDDDDDADPADDRPPCEHGYTGEARALCACAACSPPRRDPAAAPSDRCPSCGGDAGNNWFDRSICPEPCGSMHTRCVKCGTALDGCPFDVDEEPAAAPDRGSGNLPVAGGFVLLHRLGTTAEDDAYVTSWDTWEECEVAFPMERGFFLLDGETGREWLPGARYEWEDART